MPMVRFTAGVAVVLCLNTAAPVAAAMYVIDNPASTISNPADKMYNPATRTNNPASNIYNPGTRIDNPSPLSAPAPAVHGTAPTAAAPAATSVTAASAGAAPAQPVKERRQPKTGLPAKKYHYKTVAAYIRAAKRSFTNDNYVEFVSLTEDALRRIHAGTLKASAKSRRKLQKYRVLGYGLLGASVN